MDCKNGKNMKFSIVDTSLLDGKVVEVSQECEKLKMDLQESREREELKSLLRRALQLTAPTTKRARVLNSQESRPPEVMLPLRHHNLEEGFEQARGELLIDLNLPPPAEYEEEEEEDDDDRDDDDGIQLH